ncbi:FAD-dependent monooxygenase [Nocardia vulneris]|uniref:FAD-dependent monooxygenase n=1 Tax=Nocardia vulneris TaxID=1141657 RepID=UPI00069014F1|nr:FAD-dependent monooxygenase [Nocardia vulneris]
MNTAIVIGSGIGGLGAALGLTRAGWQVTVLEQADDFRTAGAGLMLAPNAVRALNWLGLSDRLRTLDAAQGATGIRTASGRWLMQGDVREVHRRFGVSEYALHQADVHAWLVDALRQTELCSGHQVTAVDPDTGTVTFLRPNGETGSRSAELVVAADGRYSPTRARLFPHHAGMAYTGYLTWQGVVPACAAADIDTSGASIESWGRGQRFGITALAAGQVSWYATLSAPPNTYAETGIDTVARLFRDWHDPIPRLLAATPPESLLRQDIYSLEAPLPTYARKRVVLLGDAAHAITPDFGQGAAQALEDAATLGRLGAQLPTAQSLVVGYDLARRGRTQRLARAAAVRGRVAQWRNPAQVALRNGLVWSTPRAVYLRSMREIYSWTPESTLAAQDAGASGTTVTVPKANS